MSRRSRMVASATPLMVEDEDPADPLAAAPPPPPPPPPAAALGTISVEYKGFLEREPRKNSCSHHTNTNNKRVRQETKERGKRQKEAKGYSTMVK